MSRFNVSLGTYLSYGVRGSTRRMVLLVGGSYEGVALYGVGKPRNKAVCVCDQFRLISENTFELRNVGHGKRDLRKLPLAGDVELWQGTICRRVLYGVKRSENGPSSDPDCWVGTFNRMELPVFITNHHS
jgi:hypothetical protein